MRGRGSCFIRRLVAVGSNPPIVSCVGKAQRRCGGGSQLRQQLGGITCRFGIADIYAFGSRAEETAARLEALEPVSSVAAPSSDLDIGVRPYFDVRLTAKDRVALTIELEDLFDVPRVDLVLLPEADPYLALDIVSGELLYTADADEEARYQLFVLHRAGDLAHFKRERIRMILERGVSIFGR